MTEFQTQCPYCFEWTEVYFEEDVRGELVQDCEVCCRPWRVRIAYDSEGHASIDVDRAQ